MSIKIGRVGLEVNLDRVAKLDQTGRQVRLDGRIPIPGGNAQLVQVRSQLLALEGNVHEPFVPVVYDEFPELNGYWMIDTVDVEMGAGSLTIGYLPFRVSMTRLANSGSPLIEARLFGSVRPNGLGVTSCTGWEGVPDAAYAHTGATAYETRSTAEGAIRIYTAGTNGLLNSYTRWVCPPEHWYNSSARIRVGEAARVNSSVFFKQNKPETYVVPEGITQVVVDVRGAQGGGRDSGQGGLGGRVVAILDVTPEEELQVRVGGRGQLRSGGYNGGGAGGPGAIAGTDGYGTNGDGWGGGGASDIRQGGTGLAHRVVVAGGGGGQGGCKPTLTPPRAGSGGYVNGGNGTNGDGSGGRGGTRGAGGAAGTPTLGWGTSGTAGASGVGGNGANAPALTFYGAGGGGGGYYGGGGGSSTKPDSYRSGAGGGGSGYCAATLVGGSGAVHKGDGSITITPITEQTAFERYTVVGHDCADAPYGWQLSNSLISVVPVFAFDRVAFQVSGWNGDGWSTPRNWFIVDDGDSLLPAGLRLSSMSIVHNSPALVAIRLTAEYSDRMKAVDIMLALRRGSNLVDVTIECATAKEWGVRCDDTMVCNAVDTYTNAIVQRTADADGSALFGVCPEFANQSDVYPLVDNPGWWLGAPATRFTFAIGYRHSDFVGTAITDVSRWYAAQSETVRAVL